MYLSHIGSAGFLRLTSEEFEGHVHCKSSASHPWFLRPGRKESLHFNRWCPALFSNCLTINWLFLQISAKKSLLKSLPVLPLSDTPQASRTSIHPPIHFTALHPWTLTIARGETGFIWFSSVTPIPGTKEMLSNYQNLQIWGMANTSKGKKK